MFPLTETTSLSFSDGVLLPHEIEGLEPPGPGACSTQIEPIASRKFHLLNIISNKNCDDSCLTNEGVSEPCRKPDARPRNSWQGRCNYVQFCPIIFCKSTRLRSTSGTEATAEQLYPKTEGSVSQHTKTFFLEKNGWTKLDIATPHWQGLACHRTLLPG